MKSTGANVKKPLSINEIELTTKFIESLRLPIVCPVSQEEYDRMNFYDPFKIYVITDKPNRVYVGDRLVPRYQVKCHYLIGTDVVDGKLHYVVYMHHDPLIEICRFPSSTDAVNALTVFNCVGNHSPITIRTLKILKMFNDREISFLTMMISLLSLFGFKDTPQLQYIMEAQRVNRSKALNSVDVPPYVVAMLSNREELIEDRITKAYVGIYQVFLNNPDIIKKSKIVESEELQNDKLIKISEELCQVAYNLDLI